MWTPEHRRAADRHGSRYPSDLSDSEWALIEPAIPPAKRGGRRREVNVREVLNAIFYVFSTGCQWQALPKDLPPKSTFVLHAVGLGRNIGAHPPRTLCRHTRARGPGSQPNCRDHRQSKRQSGSKRDPRLTRRALM